MSNNSIGQNRINSLIEQSEIEVFHRVFEKQCVVVLKLPNQFTIVGTSACVDPENYDEEIGYGIAMKEIEKKVWELEGYRISAEYHLASEYKRPTSLN